MTADSESQPSGWSWTTVGEVGVVTGGLTKNSKRDSYPVQMPYLRVANVYADRLDLDEVKTIGVTEAEVAKAVLEPGDLLVVEGNGSIDQIGRVALWDGSIQNCVHQNHIIKVRFSDEQLAKWFLLWLLSAEGRREIVQVASSTSGLHTLSISKVKRLPAPLAPENERSRIISEIDTQLPRLQAAVAGLERAQANLNRYRASVLQSAVEGRLVPTEAELAREESREYESAKVLLDRILVERRRRWEDAELESLKAKGKPPTNDKWKSKYKAPAEPDTTGLPELPEGWVWASLEQITSAERVICYGILMPKEHIPDGVLYVKVRDMKGNRLDVAQLQRTSPEIAAKYERASLRAGDLLLAIRGTYGRVVEVPPELEGGNITQDTARLALHECLNRGYVRAYLLSPDAQNYFKRVARGVAVKGVNIAEVRTTPVSIPPIGEQERILKEVDRHMSLVDELEAEADRSLKRADQLRQCILATAFEGKLVAQDPTDERAEELLERIQADRAAVEAKSSSRPRRKKA